MRFEDLDELHYIAAVGNVESILKHGILNHTDARRLDPVDISDPEVQKIRRGVKVPCGRGGPLNSYANLYICARNPMLFKVRSKDVVVLRVQPAVLELPDVVVTDGNAAAVEYTAFRPGKAGLSIVTRQDVFREKWFDSVLAVYYRQKSRKCAEVLVPDRVRAGFIFGAYVRNEEQAERIMEIAGRMGRGDFRVDINGYMFFKGGGGGG